MKRLFQQFLLNLNYLIEDVYKAGAFMLIDEQISDEKLKKKLIPDYPIGCKRIIPTNDYYPAICRDNVYLETSLIDKIEGNQIITKMEVIVR